MPGVQGKRTTSTAQAQCRLRRICPLQKRTSTRQTSVRWPRPRTTSLLAWNGRWTVIGCATCALAAWEVGRKRAGSVPLQRLSPTLVAINTDLSLGRKVVVSSVSLKDRASTLGLSLHYSLQTATIHEFSGRKHRHATRISPPETGQYHRQSSAQNPRTP
ncbi:hypothetical protein N657DRAFT_327823 [Parathielavia appendiculata]|uniref:Uncharacterized protein n=1 Tax=Parathielavia appendiculata TaxID=2587402 RepID=A0AAN6TRI5_9PEZI|nr:hypothetical protein N657DRAFT_327823 [Parathielavia appendiculata]